MIKSKKAYPLIIISLVFLFNPIANLIDVLPDFIAYALLIVAIGALSEKVPYLAECKSAIIKLALITLIKIPAFSVMYSNMAWGKDIVPLFTLVFAALELILLYSAVDYGFRSLEYIGERTDCASVREPYGKRASTPEALKKLSFIFFTSRAVLNVLPELLLLTPEDTALRRKLAESYSAVLAICILISFIAGVIWLSHAIRYANAIKKKGDLIDALNMLCGNETPEKASEKEKLKNKMRSLTALGISSLFVFDVSLSDFGGYNVLPHFIYGIILFIGVYNLSVKKKTRLACAVCTAVYSIVAIVTQFFTARFFTSFSYADLRYSNVAKDAYAPIKLLSVIETVSVILLLAISAIATIEFIKRDTDIPSDDPSYSISNKKNHRTLIAKTLPIFVIPAFINLIKCANVFLRQMSKIIHSDASSEGIVASAVPYMDTVIFFISLLCVIYTLVNVSNLKDELKFKYGDQ